VVFNSFGFGLFLPIVFLLYWAIGSSRIKWQNLLILCASYFFYGVWDWRFLLLIFSSAAVDYLAGRWIAVSRSKNSEIDDTKAAKKVSKSQEKKARYGVYVSIFWNLGVLFYFKYANFFLDNFKALFNLPTETFSTLDVIIPVGLSYYTFQTISYTVDVYQKKIKPSDNFLQFVCFVSFFPQLVAGPIERAGRLLPQFASRRIFKMSQAKDGLRRILWGLFKKVVVADNLGVAVSVIYAHPENFSSLELLYATVLFFFQLYCDFAGYTDIAVGTAKLFGFKLSENFKMPYLATNVSSFWDRWHISLSKWVRDYLFIPIVKTNKKSKTLRFFALIITMTAMGLWHGASWTFVLFGVTQGIVMAIETLKVGLGKKPKSIRQWLHQYPIFGRTHLYIQIILAMIFFRAPDINEAWLVIQGLFSLPVWQNFQLIIGAKIVVLAILLAAEFLTAKKMHPLEHLEHKLSTPLRWGVYYAFIFMIIRYGGPQETFIYFQF
jgi:D-alanyl-lipoteichoic acid acyltransferase DltB (MBOAT superfamily)